MSQSNQQENLVSSKPSISKMETVEPAPEQEEQIIPMPITGKLTGKLKYEKVEPAQEQEEVEYRLEERHCIVCNNSATKCTCSNEYVAPEQEAHCYCDTDGDNPRTCVWDTHGAGTYDDKISDCQYADRGIKRDDCKWWKPATEQSLREIHRAMFLAGKPMECEEEKGEWMKVVNEAVFDTNMVVRPMENKTESAPEQEAKPDGLDEAEKWLLLMDNDRDNQVFFNRSLVGFFNAIVQHLRERGE